MNRSQKLKYKWPINTWNMFNTFTSAEKDKSKEPEISSYIHMHIHICIYENTPVTMLVYLAGCGIPPHC